MPRGRPAPKASSKRPIDKKKSKKEGTEEAPQIDLLKTGREALQLQRESVPQQLALAQQYGGEFARNEVDTANTRAAAEMAGIRGRGAEFSRSLRTGSPEIDAATTAMERNLGELGASDIEKEQNRQALGDLKLGGQLSAEESRSANQAARAAFSARGISRGNPAAIAEVMNREQYSNSRRDQRRAYASSVDGQSVNRRSTDAAIGNNAMNTIGGFYDPQMRLYGKGGSTVSGQVNGPQQGLPYLKTAADLSTSNLQAQNAFMDRQQSQNQFDLEREDSYYFSEQNLANGNANAAKARKTSNTNGMISGAGTALGLAALAFML